MSKDIVVRLQTKSGCSRITLPAVATFSDLQDAVKAKTGVEASAQRLALDAAGTKHVTGASSALLTSMGIANGTSLHLLNTDATIAAQVLTKPLVAVEPEKPVTKAAPGETNRGKTPEQPASSSKPAASSSVAKPATASSSSSSGKNGASAAGTGTDPKFETFDQFIRNRQYDTLALPGNQRYVTGKVTKGLIKIPPSVSIKQQPYRHVDTLCVMNVPEMAQFVGYWQNHLMLEGLQRAGWMYGYYCEDKHYDEGTRAVMEGIYEPPQEMVGEIASFNADKDLAMVDRIADALGLERIGWTFTSLGLDDDQLLTPVEALRMARLQNENATDIHFTKYSLSKFVTCAVRPDPTQEGRPAMNCFMVSEQCCAMQRDGIFSDSADRHHLLVREPQKNELIPSFLVEGKENKRINTDFFVVRVNDTAPKKVRSLFTHAEFPRENRPTHPQRREDLKQYFKKLDKSEPNWSHFADFHLILYIAKEIDVDTAIAIAECIRDRKAIPDEMLSFIKQLIQ